MVKQVLDADGNIVENVEPEVKRQVLSAETSATMRELLTRSVNMTAADGKTLNGGDKKWAARRQQDGLCGRL